MIPSLEDSEDMYLEAICIPNFTLPFTILPDYLNVISLILM